MFFIDEKEKKKKIKIVEKLLTKQEVSLDKLNYDASKPFKEKVKSLFNTRGKYKIWDVVVSFLTILDNCND